MLCFLGLICFSIPLLANIISKKPTKIYKKLLLIARRIKLVYRLGWLTRRLTYRITYRITRRLTYRLIYRLVLLSLRTVPAVTPPLRAVLGLTFNYKTLLAVLPVYKSPPPPLYPLSIKLSQALLILIDSSHSLYRLF